VEKGGRGGGLCKKHDATTRENQGNRTTEGTAYADRHGKNLHVRPRHGGSEAAENDPSEGQPPVRSKKEEVYEKSVVTSDNYLEDQYKSITPPRSKERE